MEEQIKNIIIASLKQIEYISIILFGSRARGDFDKSSDYDILIILKYDMDMREKISLSTSLRRILAHNGIDVDIILKTQNEVNYYKNKVGNVVKTALEEGITL